jgi:hypothetical protein
MALLVFVCLEISINLKWELGNIELDDETATYFRDNFLTKTYFKKQQLH